MKNLCLETSNKIYVALSGGIDSVVLLHNLAKNYSVEAIHINHKLQENSTDTVMFCKKFCEQLAVKLTIVELELADITTDKENQYRKARYLAIAQNVPAGSTVALGHHSNDQLETRIKRIFSGSFIVHAMQPKLKLEHMTLVRPMLDTSKATIINYAKQHKLNWIEDPSNQDLDFERNYLRHKLIPVLTKIWPGTPKALDTFARKHTLNYEITREIAQIDLNNHSHGNKLMLPSLSQLSKSRQLNCWLAFLSAHGIKIEFVRAESLWQQCQKSKKPVTIMTNKIWVRQEGFGQLTCNISIPNELEWSDLASALPTKLGFLQVIESGNLRRPQAHERVNIRYRQLGMKLKLNGKNHHSKLKKLMQAWHIPSWQRPLWPLIYYNEQLACIPNHGICDGFFDANGISICLQDMALAPQE